MPPGPRNPPWSRDELILALDLYLRHQASPPGKTHPEVIRLSGLLNKLGARLHRREFERYRNPSGVALKLMNFRRLDPAYTASGRVGMTHGNADEPEVWRLFADHPERLRQAAEAITQAVTSSGAVADRGDNDADEGFEDAEEGRLLTRLHRARERNARLVHEKKARARRHHGRLACEACDFNFEVVYGERGQDYIECHHSKPVHTLRPGDRTQLKDLHLLCANCHRMVHARKPWLDVAYLAALVRGRRVDA